jgi:hypothetical protein
MRILVLIACAWAASLPALSFADDADMAAEYARLQSRIATTQSELTARRAQLEAVSSAEPGRSSASPFTENAACRDYRRQLRGGSSGSPGVQPAEAMIDEISAQLIRANHLAIPSLCRAVISPSAAFYAGAPDQTPVVEPDLTGQGQVEIQRDSPKTVYVTAGILNKLRDDSELAALLGHELAHLVLNYARDERAQTLAARRIDADWKDSAYAKPADHALQAWVAGGKQAGEVDADRLGAIYMRRAGYDPRGMQGLFEDLSRIESSSAKDSVKAAGPADHPPVQTRAELFAKELPDVEAVQPEARPVNRLDRIKESLALTAANPGGIVGNRK